MICSRVSIAAALLAGIVGLASAQPAPPFPEDTGGLTPVLPDTLRPEQITEENGFTLVKATGTPFTGLVVDTYAGGAKKLRRSVVDGLPEGLWMEWYESGVPRYVATWRRGRGEGLWTYFHDTGAVRERSAVVDDVFHGPVEGWHPSGVKAFEGHYRRGEKDGRWRRWDSAGRLAKIEVFRDGTLLHSETL